jgi:hypothetical protein
MGPRAIKSSTDPSIEQLERSASIYERLKRPLLLSGFLLGAVTVLTFFLKIVFASFALELGWRALLFRKLPSAVRLQRSFLCYL